jgi:hypothetical protein
VSVHVSEELLLRQVDPEIARLLEEEVNLQSVSFCLIPSEI